MRIIYTILSALLIVVAAGIYAGGPTVKFVDALSVERFVAIATPALSILALAFAIMAAVPPRRKK